MVFKNGGGLARTETWTLGGIRLKVESYFTYVGVKFTRQLSLIQMAKDQAIKGKCVLISVLSKLYQYGQLTKEEFGKIISRYRRIGYNLNVMRQSACLVFNPIMVDNYAAFFNCTPVGRASDSMMAPT